MTARAATAALVCLILAAPGMEAAAGLESPWVEGFKARTRLLAGSTSSGGSPRSLAFVEIDLPAGWKTYWRNPGDAGGLPPTFDWSKSTNLASATVLFPAPHRITDRSGDTIGYKSHVIFPVEIAAMDPSKPLSLSLALAYGICKEICVPVDVVLALDVPTGVIDAAPADALEALEAVPRAADARRSADPTLARTEVRRDGEVPRLVLEAVFPGDTAQADVFLEAPDGLYVPLPARSADLGGGKIMFEAALGDGVDLDALKGKPLTATLVSGGGGTVATFKID